MDRLYKLSFPLPMDAPHEVGLAVSEEKIFETVNDDGRTTDGQRRTLEYVSSHVSLRPQVWINLFKGLRWAKNK